MKYYPNTTRRVILAMCDAFSSVTYPDYKNNRDLVVPIHYTSVERFLAFWNQYTDERKKYNIHLPVMSIDVASIDLSDEDIQNDQIKMLSCDLQQFVKSPNTVDISFDITLWCRHDNEAILWNISEQIISKFVNIKPYPFTALKFSDGSSINYDLPIALNTNSKHFARFDIDKNTNMGIRMTFSIVVKSVKYFSALAGDPKLINTIDISFENEFNQSWAKINVFEDTGSQVVATVTDPV